MIDFMVIGLPRSRTTWLSHWLTTSLTTCLHDPLEHFTLGQLDGQEYSTRFGISDTALHLYGDELNAHKAKKLIVHRPLVQINKSLGFQRYTPKDRKKLDAIHGLHVNYSDIDENAEAIWQHLIGPGYDAERFERLKELNIQPHFAGRTPYNAKLIQRLVGR